MQNVAEEGVHKLPDSLTSWADETQDLTHYGARF